MRNSEFEIRNWIGLAVLFAMAASVPAEDRTENGDGAEKPWQFTEGNRRDPFTFARTPVEPTICVGGSTGSDEIDPTNPEDLPRVAAMYEKAEQEFLDGDYLAAMKRCALTLEAINKLKPKAALVFGNLRAELQRLDRAATLQQERLRAQQAFEALSLRVSGIVARDRRPMAVVNAQVMRPGDVVTGGIETASVEDVRAERVLFRFRGFLMEATLESDVKR